MKCFLSKPQSVLDVASLFNPQTQTHSVLFHDLIPKRHAKRRESANDVSLLCFTKETFVLSLSLSLSLSFFPDLHCCALISRHSIRNKPKTPRKQILLDPAIKTVKEKKEKRSKKEKSKEVPSKRVLVTPSHQIDTESLTPELSGTPQDVVEFLKNALDRKSAVIVLVVDASDLHRDSCIP